MKVTKEEVRAPICPYCNAPWTDGMVTVMDISASEGCDTCGYGSVKSATTVDITCSSCDRTIYRKEYED